MRTLKTYYVTTLCVAVAAMLFMPYQANAVNDQYNRVANLGTPVVDGNLNDDVWQTADWQEMDVYGGGTRPSGFRAKSAVLWDADHLYIAVEVEDSTHAVPQALVPDPGNLWQGDSPQHRVDLEYDSITNSGDDIEWGYALQDGEILTVAWSSPDNIDLVAVKIVRDDANNMTYYETAVKLYFHDSNETLSEYIEGNADAKIGYSDMVNANDGAGRIGWVEWSAGIGAGKDANLFGTLMFSHTSATVTQVGKLASTWGSLKK